MGAEYLFYMKSIETHARAFLALIILGIGTVLQQQPHPSSSLLFLLSSGQNLISDFVNVAHSKPLDLALLCC